MLPSDCCSYDANITIYLTSTSGLDSLYYHHGTVVIWYLCRQLNYVQLGVKAGAPQCFMMKDTTSFIML
jgi:hypothetical protein